MAKKKTPEQKRIGELERVLDELLEFIEPHCCPYCGTNECAVTKALDVLRG